METRKPTLPELRRKAERALGIELPLPTRVELLREVARGILDYSLGPSDAGPWEARMVAVMQEALDYLNMPGDGRDAARITLAMFLVAEYRLTCYVAPTAAEWEAALAKARGDAGTD